MSFRSRSFFVSLFALCLVAGALEYGRTGFAYNETSIANAAVRAAAGNPLFTNASTAGAIEPGRKIAPTVAADLNSGGKVSIVIMLAEQADVSAAYNIADQDDRGWFVFNTLTRHADRTQAGLRAFLQAEGVAYQPYWAANMIIAEADLALTERIADRPEVARIDSNKPTRWVEDPVIADAHDATEKESPDAIEWGVSNVNAPAVWAMGFKGQGIVVGGLDTGIRWTHNVIKSKYRGWNGTTADHNYNWHDSIHSGGGVCGANTIAPCDDNGHGTHTVGTMVGDDGGANQVGVAPDAKWIGCRNMNVGDGTPATYTECFQFTIAPTNSAGTDPDPTRRPHVLNNSWGCPVSEGCTTGSELETIVSNTQAAGIFVEVSAGNAGPNCATVNDAPAMYSDSFSTGSITINNAVSGFSSRGPSNYYNPGILKPNVVAPGSNVRSATNSSDTSYTSLSGTSMAGPHVAGVVALLWSARPQLVRDIAATKALLQSTANPQVTVTAQTCGGIPSTVVPNNSFGYGRVDVLAAVNAAGGGTPTPTNTPTATPTNIPTATPTNTPTATPTNTPTATPTNTPTATPTNTPTATPTNTPTATPTNTPTATPTPLRDANFDYDGDHRSDISVYRPSNGAWYLQRSTAGFFGVTFGLASDRIVPADYDGDGKADVAVYRPSTGYWYISNSSNGTFTASQFGVSEDIPAPGDFDGDGRDDLAVFRPSSGIWYTSPVVGGRLSAVQFGANGDMPTPGDYEGDGKADVSVYRPSAGAWYRLNSSNNAFVAEQFGNSTDKVAAADYDGDGKMDIAVFRPSEGTWYIKKSLGGSYTSVRFGLTQDIPVPGDFDGDGKTDIALFRPSNGTWYIANSSNGSYTIFTFGIDGDKPTESAFGN